MSAEGKEGLRDAARVLRDGLDAGKREKASRAICSLLEQTVGNTEKGVFIYASFGSETDTWSVIARMIERGIDVCLPRIIEQGRMEAVQWDGSSVLVKNSFGIYEPAGDGYRKPIGHIVVPGLAFDRQGGRIGYGGGYYDRWLAEHAAERVIGIAFEAQVAERVCTDAGDFPVDMLITECGLSVF